VRCSRARQIIAEMLALRSGKRDPGILMPQPGRDAPTWASALQ